MLSACLYVYADKLTACVLNVRLPNACILGSHTPPDASMTSYSMLLQTFSRHCRSLFNISNLCLVDVLLHCSPDFIIHRVKIWTVRWPLFQ